MRLERGQGRKDIKRSGKEDPLKRHADVIGKISRDIRTETFSFLNQLVTEHHAPTEDSPKDSKKDSRANAAVTSAEVLALKKFVEENANSSSHPGVNEATGNLASVLGRMEEREQKVAKEKQRRKKRLTNTSLGIVGVGAAAFATIEIVQAIQASNHAKAVAYEQTHQLTPEPSAFSYSDWRVREPVLAPGTEFDIVPQQRLDFPLVAEKQELFISEVPDEDDDDAYTGVSVEKYETSDGRNITKVKILLDPENEIYEEKLMDDPDPTKADLLELEHKNGPRLLVNLREYEAPGGGSDAIIAVPVVPKNQ